MPSTFIDLREALLDALTLSRRTAVLNNHLAGAPTGTDGQIVASRLKEFVNKMKAEAFASDGYAVHYTRLRESALYAEFRQQSSALRDFDPGTLATRQDKLVFWINLYNALMIDAVISTGVEDSVTDGWLGILAFFRRTAYIVGGQRVSAEDIEHGILRANRGVPFVPGPHFAADDPRLPWALDELDPRIHFALNCASTSCPPIGVYDVAQIDMQLDLAARVYLANTVMVDTVQEQLCLSRILYWYAADFGGKQGVLDFLQAHLPPGESRDWLMQQERIKVGYSPYDWSLNTVS